MFQTLVKMSVGTNTVEAEMMRMVCEKLSGPTGHRVLLKEEDRIKQSEIEIGFERMIRDKKLLERCEAGENADKAETETVKTQLRKARESLAEVCVNHQEQEEGEGDMGLCQGDLERSVVRRTQENVEKGCTPGHQSSELQKSQEV